MSLSRLERAALSCLVPLKRAQRAFQFFCFFFLVNVPKPKGGLCFRATELYDVYFKRLSVKQRAQLGKFMKGRA